MELGRATIDAVLLFTYSACQSMNE